MSTALGNHLVKEFEAGRISRRQLVGRLMGLGAAVATLGKTAAAQQPATESTFHSRGLDHIALDVTDVGRSRDFYAQHLGLRPLRGNGTDSQFMGGDGDFFVALFRSPRAGMNHYCHAIDHYDPDEAMERAAAAGLRPRRTDNRIYFPDPDGLTVQITKR